MSKGIIKHFALTSIATALLSLGQTASAHPGWCTSPAKGEGTSSTYTSQFNCITVGHGCSNGSGGYLGVKAASWIMPTGTNPTATAPFSTGCDPSGSNCTGVTGQPSVSKFMNSAGTYSSSTGLTTFAKSVVGTATSLADEFTNVTTLAGRFKLNQNKGVFTHQKLKLDSNGKPIGFWEKNGYVDPNAIAVTDMRMTTGAITFKPGTCATQMIIRMAGADICKIDNKLKDEHHQNLWFGGPTNIMTTGHGVHENFWLAYTVTRPASETSNCTAEQKYSIVAMPTDEEINNLAFPGWANK